jgi:hypothetical protein
MNCLLDDPFTLDLECLKDISEVMSVDELMDTLAFSPAEDSDTQYKN